MFKLEQLRCLVAVVDEGGFSRGAARLHLTQSAVSAQIRRLEEHAGCSLLTRSTRSIALTPEGERLMGYARAILRLNEDAHASVAASRFVGKVRIGASEDLASSWLPRTLRRFKALHPEILLEVDVGIPTNLLTALDEDRLDVVIGSGCRGEGRGWRLWREPLVWAFAEQDRIVSSEPIPLAFFPEPCPYREAAIESLAASQLPWRIAYISPSIAGVRAAALAGLAVTPLPRSSLCSGLVSLQPEEGLPILPDVEYLVAVNEAKSFGAVRALADMIRDRATRQGTV